MFVSVDPSQEIIEGSVCNVMWGLEDTEQKEIFPNVVAGYQR